MTTKRIETNNGTLALTVETDGSGYNWVKIPLGTSTSGGTSGTVFYNRKDEYTHIEKSNSNNDGIFIESDGEIYCALPGGYNASWQVLVFDLGIKFDKIAYENVNIYNWGAGDPDFADKNGTGGNWGAGRNTSDGIGFIVEESGSLYRAWENYGNIGNNAWTGAKSMEAPTTITNGATRFGIGFYGGAAEYYKVGSGYIKLRTMAPVMSIITQPPLHSNDNTQQLVIDSDKEGTVATKNATGTVTIGTDLALVNDLTLGTDIRSAWNYNSSLSSPGNFTWNNTTKLFTSTSNGGYCTCIFNLNQKARTIINYTKNNQYGGYVGVQNAPTITNQNKHGGTTGTTSKWSTRSRNILVHNRYT